MWYYQLFDVLERQANPENALKMSAYMRNLFPFLGIKHPQLVNLSKPYLKQAAKEKDVDWDFVTACWNKPYREAQYVAMSYLVKVAKKINADNMYKLKELIMNKSWWDTVDMLSKIVGIVVKQYPELIREMLAWSSSTNIWLRRTAILFQLSYRKSTDTILLEKIIGNNWGSGEFFIDKAIGWALREYSKTDKQWVKTFIEKNKAQMSRLSIREASKYV
ncbi:MAG: DNA alkylation repair protein [Bacteroidales bacterium]|nr:DNA alkylation repair protein [Bacteroidales bacterium]